LNPPRLQFLGKYQWQDFATAKKWKDSIEVNSKKGDFPIKTWERCCTLMPYYMDFCQQNPDQIIEEAISDNEIVRKRLRGFFNYLRTVRTLGHNPAITAAYRDQKCQQEVTLYPKEKIVAVFTKGIIGGNKTINLIAQNNQTLLEVKWDIKLTGLMSIFTGMVTKHIKNGTELALQSIKKELER